MPRVQASQILTGTLPPGFKLIVTADNVLASGTMQRFRGSALTKTSHLVADEVPYEFGPFDVPMSVSLECDRGAYVADVKNINAQEGAQPPQLTIT